MICIGFSIPTLPLSLKGKTKRKEEGRRVKKENGAGKGEAKGGGRY